MTQISYQTYTAADVSNEDAAHHARFYGCSELEAKRDLAYFWTKESREEAEEYAYYSEIVVECGYVITDTVFGNEEYNGAYYVAYGPRGGEMLTESYMLVL